MKTLSDRINKLLDEKIQEVNKVYNPACEKLSAQAEKIKIYVEKVEKSLQSTNNVLENSKLQELLSAEKNINVDITVLQNEKPRDLTTFRDQLGNTESCMKKLSFYNIFMALAQDDSEYIQLIQLRFSFQKRKLCTMSAEGMIDCLFSR